MWVLSIQNKLSSIWPKKKRNPNPNPQLAPSFWGTPKSQSSINLLSLPGGSLPCIALFLLPLLLFRPPTRLRPWFCPPEPRAVVAAVLFLSLLLAVAALFSVVLRSACCCCRCSREPPVLLLLYFPSPLSVLPPLLLGAAALTWPVIRCQTLSIDPFSHFSNYVASVNFGVDC